MSNDLTLSVSFIAEGAITTTSNINNDMSFCSINRDDIPLFVEYNLGLKDQEIKKTKITTEIYLKRKNVMIVVGEGIISVFSRA